MVLWLHLFYLILFLNVVTSQRRVVGGQRVNKNYMVYLVPSFQEDTEWLRTTAFFCGGSIITPSFVISSAACILYNTRKWVIAGYNKYLAQTDLSTDRCAQKYGRKIVYQCAHNFGSGLDKQHYYISPDNWRQADIGIAKVEKPFNFMDKGYFEYCSYPPNAIKFTTVKESSMPGIDVMVLGWGSRRYHRPKGYDFDMNEKYLMAATTVIADPWECKESYKQSIPSGVGLSQVFDKFTICTKGISNVDVYGTYSGAGKARRDSNNNTIKFEDLYLYHHTTSDTITYYSTSRNKTINSTRRSSDPGPCQVKQTIWNFGMSNDHGGPLVVWFGGREYLAGIASAFLVNENMECVGPYLYTSIACAAKFLNCTMNREVDVRRQYQDCNDLDEDDTNLTKPLETPNKTQDYWLYSD